MVAVRVLRVFADAEGRYGNLLGLVEDGGSEPDPKRRQELAERLGYSESVFVDDAETGAVRFYSARREVPFAGHAAVGVAWALAQITGRTPAHLLTAQGATATWADAGVTWVRSELRSTPAWWHERAESAEVVDTLREPMDPAQDMTQVWAWEDERAGVVRVRTFAAKVGIVEDEACGSGAMRMAAAFGRSLTLHHGDGSVIFARPGAPGYADVGGRVCEDRGRTV